MRKVYFDESGYTGQNLLDDSDPIFVLGSCSFDQGEEQKVLSHFQGFKGPELKFSRLKKTPAGQKAALAFLSSSEVTSKTVAAIVFHKPFMVVTKYCDLVLEPSFRQSGVDFYERGLNIATANLLTTVMPVFLNKATWSSFLSLFVRVVRERTPVLYNEWRKSAELIYSHLEHTHPDLAYFFAPLLLMPDCGDLFKTLGVDELNPIVPAYPVLVDSWGASIGDLYEIIADESKPLARLRGRFLFALYEKLTAPLVALAAKKPIRKRPQK